VLGSPKLWYCQMCYRCYARCPQKVNFTDVMRALRYLAVKHKFMPEELAVKSNDLETTFQDLRTSLIKESMAGRDGLLESVKALLKLDKKDRVKRHA
jgi:heterodisulfide reductase subunit C